MAVAAVVAAAAVVVEACGVCVKHSHHGCEAGCDSALSRNNRFPGDTWAATEEAFETNKQVKLCGFLFLPPPVFHFPRLPTPLSRMGSPVPL